MALERELLPPIVATLSRAVVGIDCADPAIHARFDHVLRHCAVSTAKPEVRFSVTGTSERGLRLERQGWPLYEGGDLDYLSHLLLHELLIELIRGCTDELVLHSAAVARRGAGILLCGESESGKSTLSAWLTASGFDYLTDELAVVSGNCASLTGLPRAVMLRRSSAFVLERWLDEPGRKSATRFSRKTLAVDPEALRPDSVCRRARPRALFFPRYAPGSPLAGRRLSPAEATMRLVTCSTNAVRLPEGGIPAAMALARGVEAFTVSYPDAAAAATWIEARVGG